MEKASKVMYSIANFFTWIVVIFCIVGIVFSSLTIAGVNAEWLQSAKDAGLGIGTLIGCIIVLLVSFITIAMVRRAKADDSSKAWDVFFMIVGIFGGNIFYLLGGIFGLVARR